MLSFFFCFGEVCRPPQKTQLGLERPGHNLKLFSKPEKIFKLGLLVGAKAPTRISHLSPNRVCCSGLNNGSMFYLLSVYLGIMVLFVMCFYYFYGLDSFLFKVRKSIYSSIVCNWLLSNHTYIENRCYFYL